MIWDSKIWTIVSNDLRFENLEHSVEWFEKHLICESFPKLSKNKAIYKLPMQNALRAFDALNVASLEFISDIH